MTVRLAAGGRDSDNHVMCASWYAHLAVLLPLAFACSGGDGSRKTSSASGGRCRAPSDSTVARAVTEFVKQVSPTPQRFLATAASDSAIPDLARAALQDRGPTYLFPPDTTLRRKVVEKLISVGDYTALAVVYRGTDRPDNEHTVIRLGGHFVDVGKGVPPSVSGSMEFACDSTAKWKFVRKTPDPAS